MRVIPHVERVSVTDPFPRTISGPLPMPFQADGGTATLLAPEAPATGHAVPREVELIMSAMEAGGTFPQQRRALRRIPWRVKASLRLFVDAPGQQPRTIYTRDVHARSLGFITNLRLPLGYGGVVDLPAADGTIFSVACTLLRCRQAAPGWFEGVVYFNREQTGVETIIG